MRQTNHNGRYNAKTGKVYSRKHNDRQYDVEKAENINEDLVRRNIIIHYDEQNKPVIINPKDTTAPTIDEHEHQLYESLFGQSIAAQNRRNDAARHSERNKTIDDLLDSKTTCPEENIFQIGSLEDGYIDEKTLLAIYNEYHQELINRLGNNIHFLDAVLHLDEAVPHIHERRVYTYKGKDGLDISQNKSLEQMGFERPNPDKSPSKYNNAKISFSEWERNLKLDLCKKHGLEIEIKPLEPGKNSLDKEEAIGLKLQRQNQELREETELIEAQKNDLITQKDNEITKKNHEIEVLSQKIEKASARLFKEEELNKEVSGTNIFGHPNKITITPQELRSYKLAAETKERNDERQKELEELEKDCQYREDKLEAQEIRLISREKNIENEIEDRVQEMLPQRIKEWKEYIPAKSAELHNYEANLNSINLAQELREMELQDREDKLNKRKNNLDNEIRKTVAAIIKEQFQKLFNALSQSLFQRFSGRHQQRVLSVLETMPLNTKAINELKEMGYYPSNNDTVRSILNKAEVIDIRESLHKSGVAYSDIEPEDIALFRQALNKGKSLDSASNEIANKIIHDYYR